MNWGGSRPEPQVVSLGRGLCGGPRFWGHSTSTSGSVTNTITWPGRGRESFGSQQGSPGGRGMGLLKCGQGPYARRREGWRFCSVSRGLMQRLKKEGGP